jgi:hypothetical protein
MREQACAKRRSARAHCKRASSSPLANPRGARASPAYPKGAGRYGETRERSLPILRVRVTLEKANYKKVNHFIKESIQSKRF